MGPGWGGGVAACNTCLTSLMTSLKHHHKPDKPHDTCNTCLKPPSAAVSVVRGRQTYVERDSGAKVAIPPQARRTLRGQAVWPGCSWDAKNNGPREWEGEGAPGPGHGVHRLGVEAGQE